MTSLYFKNDYFQVLYIVQPGEKVSAVLCHSSRTKVYRHVLKLFPYVLLTSNNGGLDERKLCCVHAWIIDDNCACMKEHNRPETTTVQHSYFLTEGKSANQVLIV